MSAGQRRARDRLAAGFLLVVLFLGTVALWVGVPVLCLWAASKVTSSIAGHFLVATPATLAAMTVFVWLLYWVDRLYLRVTGAYYAALYEYEDEDEDEEEPPRVVRGPLEPMLIASLVLGVIALFVWFFVFAENPSSQVI